MSTSVIDKIKKLLRLARSANQHEAELAMQRAMQLAAEHRVEIDTLNLSDDSNATTHRDSSAMARLSYDRKYAALICQRFFRCKPVLRHTIRHDADGWPRSGEKFSFVGTESDVEIGLYVYEFLFRHFAACWRRKRGRCRNRYAFVTGIYEGLYHKLQSAEPPAPVRMVKGTELQLSVDAYIAIHIGDTEANRMTGAKANAARWRGYLEGRKTNIAPAVKSGSPQPLALRS